MAKKRNAYVIALFIILLLLALASIIYAIYQQKISNAYGNNIISGNKSYIGNSKEECSRIQFLCAPDYREFQDKKGCGCEYVGSESGNLGEKHYCTAQSRQADVCIELYLPVCGWFSQEIKCIRYPCAQTFSNRCFACMDDKVEYWTDGECPG